MNRRQFLVSSAATTSLIAGIGFAQSSARALPILPLSDFTQGIVSSLI